MWTVESIKVNSTQTRHRSSRAAKTRKEKYGSDQRHRQAKRKTLFGRISLRRSLIDGRSQNPRQVEAKVQPRRQDHVTTRQGGCKARCTVQTCVCVWGRCRNKMTRRGWSEEQNALQERGGDNRSITYGFQKGMVDLSRLGRWHDEARDQKMRKSGLWLHAYCGRWEEKFYHRY